MQFPLGLQYYKFRICDDLWGDNEKDQWIRAGDEYPSKSTRYVDLTNEILSKKVRNVMYYSDLYMHR